MTQRTGIGDVNRSTYRDGAAVGTAFGRTANLRASGRSGTAAQGGPRNAGSGATSRKAVSSRHEDDVRLDKVIALRAAIESGTYQVPASAVVDRLMSVMTREQNK